MTARVLSPRKGLHPGGHFFFVAAFMTKLRVLFFVLAASLSFATAHGADKLILDNGDSIRGEYISNENGIITFKSPILGVITVPADKAEVQSPTEVSEEVDGPAIPSAGEQLADAASSEEPDPNAQAEPAPKTQEQIEAEEQAEYFDQLISEWKDSFQSIIPDGWSGNINVGFTYTNAASTTTSLVTGFKAKKDKYGGGFNYKYDLSDDWFVTSTTSYLHDQVKGIKNQATEQIGVGYRIINDDDMKLSVNGGMAGQYNYVGGVSQKWYYYVTAGDSFEYHFNKYFRVEQNFNIRVDPNETDQYQYYFNIAGIAKLTDWIEASLSYNYNYDNTVSAGASKGEENIVFALGVPF
jgi:putative salt-induced outer membrane protein YdiY